MALGCRQCLHNYNSILKVDFKCIKKIVCHAYDFPVSHVLCEDLRVGILAVCRPYISCRRISSRSSLA